ncbi:saccharopine dehydrogenase-like oxidoreductase isoform X1 [Teleopsis dalmanni]|uniref:saccharopine dehydrogenase-like oxidoreductase isoform X1 n=1 Tax=Teleopsis dalmanni TaxID=139649 RepID=UPI0018CDEB12|nr:saccharopine dehydrogenase-like oxidoreductase isoform X1 [Teleopsis dalmanni]
MGHRKNKTSGDQESKDEETENNALGRKMRPSLGHSLSRLFDRLDFIIYGATGFHGKNTVLMAASMICSGKWGFGGRDKEKLNNLLLEINGKNEGSYKRCRVFIADTSNTTSLKKMTSKCQVLINCCGSYNRTAEDIIKSCLSTRTHYVDICNDVHFLELLQLKYHEEAKRRNVYIIFACGFKGLPMDVGFNFLRDNFDGTVNSVEAHTRYDTTAPIICQPIISASLWESFLKNCSRIFRSFRAHHMAKVREFRNLEPKTTFRFGIHKNRVIGGHSAAYPFLDQQIVENSQYYMYKKDHKRPIQINNYIAFRYFIMTLTFIIWNVTLAVLCRFQWMRIFLLKYPRIFSLGYASHDGPKEFYSENLIFDITLNAVGWSSIDDEANLTNTQFLSQWGLPRKRMTIKIQGNNPFYKASPLCVLASALTILRERDFMPSLGGVYFPGAAFAETNIVTLLERNGTGIIFEVLN